jgi:hypothetical protein
MNTTEYKKMEEHSVLPAEVVPQFPSVSIILSIPNT